MKWHAPRFACTAERDNRVYLREHGAIDLTIAAMERHGDDEVTTINGVGCLWNITVDDVNQVYVCEHGGIEVILRAMERHTSCARVQQSAIGTMRNVSVAKANLVHFVEDRMGARLCAAVCRAMRRYADDERVNIQASALIWHLVTAEEVGRKNCVGGGAWDDWVYVFGVCWIVCLCVMRRRPGRGFRRDSIFAPSRVCAFFADQ